VSFASRPAAAGTSRAWPTVVRAASGAAVGAAGTARTDNEEARAVLGKYVQMSRPFESPRVPVEAAHSAFALFAADVPKARCVLAESKPVSWGAASGFGTAPTNVEQRRPSEVPTRVPSAAV
jgi:hypothetical protein